MYDNLFSLPTMLDYTDAELTGPVPPVEAVLFDFANTLFRMVPTDVFLERVWAAADRDPATLDSGDLARKVTAAGILPHVLDAQVGRDLSLDAHRAAMRVWFREIPELADVFDHVYDEILATRSWFPYRDTESVLHRLAARGIPVGVISDIVWDVRDNLREYGLDDAVRSCTLSFEAGYEKPDPRVFLKACADLGADPRATLMVGDNPMRDGGAAICGMRVAILPAEPRIGDRGLDVALRMLD